MPQPQTKAIVIPYSGPIVPKSGVYGPITMPYHEKLETIVSLLNYGYPVEEVLESGEHVALNFKNYNKDLSGAASAHAEVDVPVAAPVSEPVVPKAPVAPEGKQLSNKEKRKLEQEKKNQEAASVEGDITPAE